MCQAGKQDTKQPKNCCRPTSVKPLVGNVGGGPRHGCTRIVTTHQGGREGGGHGGAQASHGAVHTAGTGRPTPGRPLRPSGAAHRGLGSVGRGRHGACKGVQATTRPTSQGLHELALQGGGHQGHPGGCTGPCSGVVGRRPPPTQVARGPVRAPRRHSRAVSAVVPSPGPRTATAAGVWAMAGAGTWTGAGAGTTPSLSFVHPPASCTTRHPIVA